MMAVSWIVLGLAVFVALLLLMLVVTRAARNPTVVEPAEIDVDALNDPGVQAAMQAGRKIEAIAHYRDLTGVGLKEAKGVIDYVMAGGAIGAKKKRALPPVDTAAGVRDLLDEGRKDEAVELYARFAGVDQYTARDAVDEIEREMRLGDTPDEPGKLTLLERGEIQP